MFLLLLYHLLFHLLPLLVPAVTLLHPDNEQHQVALRLNQAQSCSFQPSSSNINCRCSKDDATQILHLRLSLLDNIQQVSQVTVQSCTQLLLTLDLSGVNTTNMNINIKDCGKVQVENIKSDPIIPGDQKLNFVLENLENFIIQEQTIEGEILISSTNVSVLFIYKTIFSSQSSPRIDIKMADKVSIIDSVFNTTTNGAITLDTVKKVEIVNNEFSIDTVKVLITKDSPNLYISCNRLHGETFSMECVTISPALHSVSSAISLSSSYLPPPSPDIKSAKPYSGSPNTILWLLVGVGLSVLSLVTVCVCCRGRRKRGEEEENFLKSNIETERNEVENNHEKDIMLISDNEKNDNVDIVIESDDIIEKVMEQEAVLKSQIEGTKSH